MGAWSYGVFGDDTAYDALDDLKASKEIIRDMEHVSKKIQISILNI